KPTAICPHSSSPTIRAAFMSSGWITAASAKSRRCSLVTETTPEHLGRELSDLAFGIVEQNWLEQHIGKVIELQTIVQRDAAEWELTYLILFAITHGCGTFASTDPERTTAVLKAFHGLLLRHIAEQAGQEVA